MPANRTEVASHVNDNDLFADLVDRVIQQFQEGERVSLVRLIETHPTLSDKLRAIWPSLEAMAQLRNSSGGAEPSHHMTTTNPDLPLRRTIGDFRILGELGRGGMGIVYEAEQISMARHVALKMLPFAAVADSKAMQRFKNEVRAAASLNHTNIIPVYSIGEDKGIHYYVMQLVHGQTLADVIHELRRMRRKNSDFDGSSIMEAVDRQLSSAESSQTDPTQEFRRAAQQDTKPKASLSTVGSPTNKEFFRSVAQLGAQAADALHHAHERGVLHRDIKPGNLMLDADAHLYVTDFGLARIQTDAGVTMTGDLVGTLRYMSPEQALAKRIVVDHRSDIYSLGATLYELLTLEPVIDGQDREEMLRRIAFHEPQKPRRLNRSIPRELETILLKTLAKNPEERYESADELAADLRRFLEDQPIRAKPPTLLQHTSRWARRHRSIVAALATILLLAVVGLAVSNFLIAGERDIARQERDEAERQKQRADESFRKAKEAVDTYLTAVAENELLDTPSMQSLREQLMKSALGFYQDFVTEREDDPSLQRELANAYSRIGGISRTVGSLSDALKAFQEEARVRQRLVANSPQDAKLLMELIDSHEKLVSVTDDVANREDAAALGYTTLDCCTQLESLVSHEQYSLFFGKCCTWIPRRCLESRDIDVLGALDAADAHLKDLADQDFEQYGDLLAGSYAARADLLNGSERIRWLELAKAARERLLELKSDSIAVRTGLAHSEALLCLAASDLEEKLSHGQRTIELLTPILSQNSRYVRLSHDLAIVHHSIGWQYSANGDWENAIEHHRESMKYYKAVVEQQPRRAISRDNFLKSQWSLTGVLKAAGKFNEFYELQLEREAFCRECVATHPSEFTDDHRRILAELASAHMSDGQTDYAAARKCAEEAIRLACEKPELCQIGMAEAEAAQVVSMFDTLRNALEAMGKESELLDVYEEALRVSERVYSEAPHNTYNLGMLINISGMIAEQYMRVGASEEAIQVAQKHFQLRTTFISEFPAHADVARCRQQLLDVSVKIARFLRERRDYENAVKYSKQIVDQVWDLPSSVGSGVGLTDDFAMLFRELCFSMAGLGQEDDVIRYHELRLHSAAGGNSKLPADEHGLALCITHLCELSYQLHQRERLAEANQVSQQLIGCCNRFIERFPVHPDIPACRKFLAETYELLGERHRQLGEFELAASYFEIGAVIPEQISGLDMLLSLRRQVRRHSDVLVSSGRREEAISSCLAWIESGEKLVEKLPGSFDHRHALSSLYEHLSQLYLDEGLHERAIQAAERRCEVLKENLDNSSGTDDREIIVRAHFALDTAYMSLGELQLNKGDFVGAKRSHAAAIEVLLHEYPAILMANRIERQFDHMSRVVTQLETREDIHALYRKVIQGVLAEVTWDEFVKESREDDDVVTRIRTLIGLPMETATPGDIVSGGQFDLLSSLLRGLSRELYLSGELNESIAVAQADLDFSHWRLGEIDENRIMDTKNIPGHVALLVDSHRRLAASYYETADEEMASSHKSSADRLDSQLRECGRQLATAAKNALSNDVAAVLVQPDSEWRWLHPTTDKTRLTKARIFKRSFIRHLMMTAVGQLGATVPVRMEDSLTENHLSWVRILESLKRPRTGIRPIFDIVLRLQSHSTLLSFGASTMMALLYT
ncbi:MAG: serine/threonine protein kinase [Planctomycetales bacterium]|nr:serine/threonine protein kinase [Planctomycetales bacterium]